MRNEKAAAVIEKVNQNQCDIKRGKSVCFVPRLHRKRQIDEDTTGNMDPNQTWEKKQHTIVSKINVQRFKDVFWAYFAKIQFRIIQF